MRALCLGALVATALAVATAGSAALRPRLAVVRADPVTLQGRHFRAGEAVRIQLVMGDRSWARSTHAGGAGGFVVSFGGVRLRYCADPLTISARGTRSGTVYANLPVAECAAP